MESKATKEKLLNNAIHGNIYQLKVLMLFLYRGISNRYSFRLGTEIQQAHKFDDLVFEYLEGRKKIYRLLQAKHRLDETKKITASQLRSNKSDFSLLQYFFSYQSLKKELLFKNGSIRDVTICTNIDFDLKDLKQAGFMVTEITDKDDILGVVSEKQPRRYKFSKIPEDIIKSANDKQDFLSHLVFAVNQPNEDELGDIIMREIGREFDFLTTETVYNKFFIKMLNWLQGKGDGVFLSSEEGKRFFEEARNGIPIWFGLRDPIESFVGREAQLEGLHGKLHDDTGLSKSVAIAGLGGVGKSELARMYAKTYSSLHNDKVVWVQAESYQSLVESFHRLACDVLRISTKNVDGEEKKIRSIVEDVYKFFSKGKSLFIFDNASKFKTLKEFDEGLDKFLPALPTECRKPHFLITTRNLKWPENVIVLPLGTFSQGEAEEFIIKSLNIEGIDQKHHVTELANELQYFPLGLQQAVAYIKVNREVFNNVRSKSESNFNIEEYLQRYKTKTEELLKFKFPEDSDIVYTKTIMSTWVVTFDEIARNKDCGQYALTIVDIIAYVSADDIPIEIFSSLVKDDKKLGSALELLKQYSIITNLNDGKFDVHRLLQKVVGIRVKGKNEEKKVLNTALEVFSYEGVNLANLEHAIMVWHYSSIYTDVVSQFCNVACSISRVLIEAFRGEEAYSFSLKVTEQFLFILNMLPERKNSVAIDEQIRYNLLFFLSPIITLTAQALLAQGKYDLALKYLRTRLVLINQTFGTEHVRSLVMKSHIGDILRLLGKYDDALKYYEEAYAGLKLKSGDDDASTLNAKSGISDIHFAKGNFAESLKMFREIYKIKESKFGKYGNSTIDTRKQIAILLNEMGKYEESLEIFEELRDYEEKTLKKNHPDTLKTKFRIASILSNLDRGDPMNIYEEILVAQKQIYGEEHLTFLKTLGNIGVEKYKKGEYKEAIEIYRKVLDKKVHILGPDHTDILTDRCNIAVALDALGEHEEALKIFQEVLPTQCKVQGSEHPETNQTKLSLAEQLAKIGKFDEAIKHFRDVKVNSTTDIPNSHLVFQFNVGVCFLNQGQYDGALEIFKNLLDKQLTCLKSDDPELLITKHLIGETLERNGRYSEASAEFEDELHNARKTLGEDHDDTLIASLHLAYCKSMLREFGKAQSLCQEAMKTITEVPGKCCTEWMIARLSSVSGVFHDQDKHNEVSEIDRFLLHHQKRTQDDHHVEVAKKTSTDPPPQNKQAAKVGQPPSGLVVNPRRPSGPPSRNRRRMRKLTLRSPLQRQSPL